MIGVEDSELFVGDDWVEYDCNTSQQQRFLLCRGLNLFEYKFLVLTCLYIKPQ